MPFAPPLTLVEVQESFAGKYVVDAAIQAGGQGAVFKARAQPDGATAVALKVYCSDQLEARLEREFAALKALRGPTLVELCDAGTCAIRGAQCRYLATTFIEGRPLDAVIATEGARPLDRVARIGHDVALALEQVWGARVVHRDVKPNNVMLTRVGGGVLIDLGVARHVDLASLTTTGKTWGTAGYLSPEQTLGHPLTCKSDVFALGLVLQECILGRHPTNRRQELLMSGGAKTDGLRANLPRFLVHLIDSMVNKRAIQRPLPGKVSRELEALAGLSSKEFK